MEYSRHFEIIRSFETPIAEMEALKRLYTQFSSVFLHCDEEENAPQVEKKRRVETGLVDPLAVIPDQIFVQVLLASQFDLPTTAWMFARVSRRWKDAIEAHLGKRWKSVDKYHPFLWSTAPPLSVGLIPPMFMLLDEWGRQGWLGLLKWALRLGFPLLHPDDREFDGQHTLLLAACLGGHHVLVAWVLYGLCGYLDKGKALEGACRSGNDALLRWLIEEGHIDPSTRIPIDENPASRGNLEMCQWLVKRDGCPLWLTAAGRNDHRNILEWAISEGHAVDFLVWPVLLRLAHCPPRTPQANGAAAAGRLDTLEWLWQRLGGNPEASVWNHALGEAAEAGQLAAVKWMLDQGCKCYENYFYWAVKSGHVDVVALLWKRIGIEESKDCILGEEVAEFGSLSMLQWMVDHGLPLTVRACATAAQYGHLDALRFLRSHHCPWDSGVLQVAAYNGHLDILQWALANECPWAVKDRQDCLRLCPRHRTGMRCWIEECWPKKWVVSQTYPVLLSH